MFPYSLGQQLSQLSSDNKKKDQPSNSENNNQQKHDKPHNWFHCYQVPAEKPAAAKSEERKPRSKSLGELPNMPHLPMYQPMNPEKKVEWSKFMPHPKEKDIQKYEYQPMNPEKKMEWSKLVPHPKVNDIQKYEYQPMNPEKKMEWSKLIPHPQKKQNWFHCYQIPSEKPVEKPQES